MRITQKIFKVIVKPNSPKNKIICFDNNKQAYRITIKAKAEKNEANKELIKFLSKTLNKKVKIKKGLKSREKIIKIG